MVLIVLATIQIKFVSLTFQYHKHLFVHLGPNVNFQDSILEAVDIRQIYDKFPEKKGGLRELYEKGPQSVFFLVKFWVCLTLKLIIT